MPACWPARLSDMLSGFGEVVAEEGEGAAPGAEDSGALPDRSEWLGGESVAAEGPGGAERIDWLSGLPAALLTEGERGSGGMPEGWGGDDTCEQTSVMSVEERISLREES